MVTGMQGLYLVDSGKPVYLQKFFRFIPSPRTSFII